MNSQVIRTTVLGGVVILLAACAGTPQLAAIQPGAMAWPSPPGRARVVFRQELANAEDLGIRKGVMRWLREMLTGEEEYRLIRPMAVVATRDGRIYVADPGARGVHLFDLVGNAYQLLRAEGDRLLPSPVGLCEGRNGTVYVTDSQLGRVFVHQSGEDSLRPFRLIDSIAQPTGIACDTERGLLYVVDTLGHAVHIVDGEGRSVKTFGGRGSAPGQFNFPTYLWLSADGLLAVTDSLNFRVQLFDRDGHPRGMFGRAGDASGNLSRPKGVAMDRDGNIYVVDALFHAIQVFDRQGRLLLALGEQGQGQGQFWLPGGIFIAPDGDIYVADSHNRRVQILRYLGGPS